MTGMLLIAREHDATVCPSEVARKLAATEAVSDWRELMPQVHAAVDALLADGDVILTWKGKRLASRAGPYRIGKVRN